MYKNFNLKIIFLYARYPDLDQNKSLNNFATIQNNWKSRKSRNYIPASNCPCPTANFFIHTVKIYSPGTSHPTYIYKYLFPKIQGILTHWKGILNCSILGFSSSKFVNSWESKENSRCSEHWDSWLLVVTNHYYQLLDCLPSSQPSLLQVARLPS